MVFTFERIKYPIFVLGAVLMTLPAIIYKYHPFQVSIVTYSVLIGFILSLNNLKDILSNHA